MSADRSPRTPLSAVPRGQGRAPQRAGRDIPDATVGDAVMMLDLRNTNALMFRNAKSGAFNMVYRRDDGTIGWVEPPTQ